jgi:hypothetical protein
LLCAVIRLERTAAIGQEHAPRDHGGEEENDGEKTPVLMKIMKKIENLFEDYGLCG